MAAHGAALHRAAKIPQSAVLYCLRLRLQSPWSDFSEGKLHFDVPIRSKLMIIFATLGPAGSNHELVMKRYLALHGLEDAAIVRVADLGDALRRMYRRALSR
ncbi:MAG: hypothetical protein H8D70_01240 [Rhodospirillaceae bacterium]|nr:hypothetical protein [Rhodospirillaceae bacterium]